jgi:hypothetical protein
MRVVNAAAHFGACLAEELNPGVSHTTFPSCGRAVIGSLASESLGPSCLPVPSAASFRSAANLGRSPTQDGGLSACRHRTRAARHTETPIHNDRVNAASRGVSAFLSTRHFSRRLGKRFARDAALAKEKCYERQVLAARIRFPRSIHCPCG